MLKRDAKLSLKVEMHGLDLYSTVCSLYPSTCLSLCLLLSSSLSCLLTVLSFACFKCVFLYVFCLVSTNTDEFFVGDHRPACFDEPVALLAALSPAFLNCSYASIFFIHDHK